MAFQRITFTVIAGPLFKKSVSDANAPTQEKALDALMAYLRAADADVSRCASVYLFCLVIVTVHVSLLCKPSHGSVKF